MSGARDLVEVVANALADYPDAVKVTESERGDTLLIELTAGPGDLGKLIGRQGRTAAAIRTLASEAGERDGRRVSVDFLD